MPEEINNDARDKAMLVNLVMMLGTGAMQQLGKIVDPVTNKAEVNLEAAQASIDMLAMLQVKTKGNLDDNEKGLIDNTLASLQMNYVETARDLAGKETTEGKTQPKEQPAGQGESGEKDVAAPGEKPDAKDPKYHKSYG